MKSNRIALIAGVVVLAVVVGFLAFRNNWPPTNGTEGAIGAANRYTARQMSDQDVVLKDEKVQAFLQSDTFHQLATNAEFRRCVESAVFIEAIRQPNVVEMLSRSAEDLKKLRLPAEALSALTSAELKDFSPKQTEALFSVESAQLFANPKFGEMIRSAEFKKAVPNGVAEAVKINQEFAQFGPKLTELARLCPEYMIMLADPAFITWMDNQKGGNLLAEFGKFATPELSMLMADNNVRQILANRDFQQLEGLQAFTDALKMEGMKTLLGSNVDPAAYIKF